MSYREYKCSKCGWVHAAIPLEEALEQVKSANEWLASKYEPMSGDIARYMRCFRCSAATADFVPAQPEDAPTGCTIQCVVVPVAWP